VPPPVAQELQPTAPALPIDKHLIIENDTASIGPIEPPIAPVTPSPAVALPFGLGVTPVAFGQILTKWDGVETKIRADNDVLSRCDSDPQHCPKAAQIFRDIIAQGRARTGLARIGAINRAVNLTIEPESDMAQWGVPDRWSDPLETFATGRGDCEDYAIAKFVALMAAGVPAKDVKLVIVRNTAAGEDHAVVAARNDGDWIILDNRWLTMVKDAEMAKAVPLFVLDHSGVRAFVAPMLTVARAGAAPASMPF
jgi:predicted transglutaminase-like cysteine proteinase